MNEFRVIEIKQGALADNDRDAAALRARLKREKTFLLNLMGSPGAGKTSVLTQTIRRLAGKTPIAVMEADIDSDVDARAVAETGAPVIQLHTGGMCHLDAEMTRQGLAELNAPPGIVVLENVGNLVCPAEFDTGAAKNAMILSVPEGDDKPLKYPLMFTVCDALLINKIDAVAMFDFDMEAAAARARVCNPAIRIFPVSAKTGAGMDAFADWLLAEAAAHNA